MEEATTEDKEVTKSVSDIGAAPTTSDVEKPLSKRQLKKQARKLKFEETKHERRKEEKLARKKRKAEKAAANDGPIVKRPKVVKMEESSCCQRVVVDMSFDDKMSERDRAKALNQLQYCYSSNRRAENPMQFYITNFCGKTRQLFNKIQGCANWDVFVKIEDYLQLFDKDTVVYLSSDSPNVIDTLDVSKVYVIGGLIDHNFHKGLCHRLAVEKGIQHARLPIEQYLEMKTRKVLTINHVFDILLRYTANKNWEESFFSVLPKRKGAITKNFETEEESKDSVESSKEDRSEMSTDKILN